MAPCSTAGTASGTAAPASATPPGQGQGQGPARPGADADDADEEWVPGQANLRGDWRSGRRDNDSPQRALPPLPGPRGVTTLAGQALRLNGRPLRGVTLRLGDHVATTD